MKLTKAQLRGLVLLARPGAVAHTAREIRWRVLVDGKEQTGTIHSTTLLVLRSAGYVEWLPASVSQDAQQRITDAGRARLTEVVAG